MAMDQSDCLILCKYIYNNNQFAEEGCTNNISLQSRAVLTTSVCKQQSSEGVDQCTTPLQETLSKQAAALSTSVISLLLLSVVRIYNAEKCFSRKHCINSVNFSSKLYLHA